MCDNGIYVTILYMYESEFLYWTKNNKSTV